MKKVYLAHPISTTGEFNDSIRVAERIVKETMVKFGERPDGEPHLESKYEVYAPALNKAINDKANNPTPQMIYEQDVEQLLSSDILVVNYTGGDADGTVLEIGILGGLVEAIGILSDIKNDFPTNKNRMLDMITNVKYSTGKLLNENEIKHVYHLVIANAIAKYVGRLPKVLVYSSNQRATNPQLYSLVHKQLFDSKLFDNLKTFLPSGKLNAMVVGIIEKHFKWFNNEDEVIECLKEF